MVQPDTFKDKFNDLSSEILAGHAQKIRRDFIGMCTWVLKDRLLLQQAAKSTVQSGEKLDYWVKSTDVPVAAEGVQPSPTMSFAVEGVPEANGFPRLRVHVPVPDDFRSDSISDIQSLVVPQAVFPERLVSRKGRVVSLVARYAVTNADFRTYPIGNTAADAGPELWVPGATFSRVQTRLPELTQLVEDLVDWNLVPQSRTIVGLGQVVDL